MVKAQRECRMYTTYIRRGQRVCQRLCLRSPQIRCHTSRFGERISLCPPNCCRVSNTCRPPRTQLGCRMYSVVLRPGQRVCQRMCYPRGGRPDIICHTARRVERQYLCHPTCCRFGDRCHQLLYA
ncbi:hypothetical protein FF38_03105 [Lucilia cuprina]|uniref:Uncharacterized protein n=1 Tax=Lucilia cuprina TaxID=7375 RepID=A0A0L0CJX0_LUCCU|nr:hypothetical protein FF38_03105 [Lucilia cuprina]